MRFEEEITIKATPEAVYNLIAKSTNLSKLVPDLSVKILEVDEDYQISQWQITIDEQLFKWKQRENFDPELMTVNYSFIEGDFEHMDARWKVASAGEESEIIFQVELELKDKSIKAYLAWPLSRKKMHQVCREIVQAVKDRLELSYGQSL